MLAKARGFGLGITPAHQYLGQLPTAMRQAVLAIARTKVIPDAIDDDSRALPPDPGHGKCVCAAVCSVGLL